MRILPTGLPDPALIESDVFGDERGLSTETYLGPLDGASASRTRALLCDEAEAWAVRRGPEASRLREQLAQRRARRRV